MKISNKFLFQIQENVYLDLFLFNPNSRSRCSSELNVIDILIQSGKEKFLIHPLIEIFMKLKWQKTWFLFFIYMIIFGLFFFTLAGYSLAHYGLLYKDCCSSLNGTTTKDFEYHRSTWW